MTHSGAPDCQPVDKVYWPECTIVGEKIDAGSIIASSDPPFDCKSMEQCSLNCTLESTCTHWNFLAGMSYLLAFVVVEARYILASFLLQS